MACLPRFAVIIAMFLAACTPSDEGRVQTMIGAVLIDGTGAPPVDHAVIVVEGTKFRAVGNQVHTPIPKGGRNIDLRGKFVAPAGAGTIEPGKPANLRVLSSNPLEHPTALTRVEREMVEGRWVETPKE